MPEWEQVSLSWAHYQPPWSRSKPSRQVPRGTNSKQSELCAQPSHWSITHTHTHTPPQDARYLSSASTRRLRCKTFRMMQRQESAQKFMGSFSFADMSWLYLLYLCSVLSLQGELMEWYRGKSIGLAARRFWSSEQLLCELGLGSY